MCKRAEPWCGLYLMDTRLSLGHSQMTYTLQLEGVEAAAHAQATCPIDHSKTKENPLVRCQHRRTESLDRVCVASGAGCSIVRPRSRYMFSRRRLHADLPDIGYGASKSIGGPGGTSDAAGTGPSCMMNNCASASSLGASAARLGRYYERTVALRGRKAASDVLKAPVLAVCCRRGHPGRDLHRRRAMMGVSVGPPTKEGVGVPVYTACLQDRHFS